MHPSFFSIPSRLGADLIPFSSRLHELSDEICSYNQMDDRCLATDQHFQQERRGQHFYLLERPRHVREGGWWDSGTRSPSRIRNGRRHTGSLGPGTWTDRPTPNPTTRPSAAASDWPILTSCWHLTANMLALQRSTLFCALPMPRPRVHESPVVADAAHAAISTLIMQDPNCTWYCTPPRGCRDFSPCHHRDASPWPTTRQPANRCPSSQVDLFEEHLDLGSDDMALCQIPCHELLSGVLVSF